MVSEAHEAVQTPKIDDVHDYIDTKLGLNGPGKPGHTTGYLPDLGDAFLKSGRPRGPGKALKIVGGEAPHILEGLPGPPGPARPQKRTQQKNGHTAQR